MHRALDGVAFVAAADIDRGFHHCLTVPDADANRTEPTLIPSRNNRPFWKICTCNVENVSPVELASIDTNAVASGIRTSATYGVFVVTIVRPFSGSKCRIVTTDSRFDPCTRNWITSPTGVGVAGVVTGGDVVRVGPDGFSTFAQLAAAASSRTSRRVRYMDHFPSGWDVDRRVPLVIDITRGVDIDRPHTNFDQFLTGDHADHDAVAGVQRALMSMHQAFQFCLEADFLLLQLLSLILQFRVRDRGVVQFCDPAIFQSWQRDVSRPSTRDGWRRRPGLQDPLRLRLRGFLFRHRSSFPLQRAAHVRSPRQDSVSLRARSCRRASSRDPLQPASSSPGDVDAIDRGRQRIAVRIRESLADDPHFHGFDQTADIDRAIGSELRADHRAQDPMRRRLFVWKRNHRTRSGRFIYLCRYYRSRTVLVTLSPIGTWYLARARARVTVAVTRASGRDSRRKTPTFACALRVLS